MNYTVLIHPSTIYYELAYVQDGFEFFAAAQWASPVIIKIEN